MKKTVLLSMVLILLLVNIMPAFADAAAYDIENADYYVYVATPDGGLNMRYGPGTEYDKVMQERIPDGVKLYISMVSGDWGYTSYNGNDGWVALKQTTKTAPQPVTAPVEEQPPVVEEEPQTEQPAQVEEEPENVETPAPVTPEDNSADAERVKSSMFSEIVMVAALVFLMIIIAVLIVIIINLKSKK